MSFKNLLVQHKDVSIQGVNLTLRKWRVGFSYPHELDRQALYGDEDNPPETKPTADQIRAYFVDEVFEAIVTWDLQDEEGKVLPVTRESVEQLALEYPEFFILLRKMAFDFNFGLDQETKKKSRS